MILFSPENDNYGAHGELLVSNIVNYFSKSRLLQVRLSMPPATPPTQPNLRWCSRKTELNFGGGVYFKVK